MEELEYLVFPRLIAYAEIGWLGSDKKSWNNFKNRLGQHGKRLRLQNINFYKSPQVPWQ